MDENQQVITSIWDKLTSITQSILPSMHCMICHVKTSEAICAGCSLYFIPLGSSCKTCATPLTDSSIKHCGPCIIRPPAINSVITHYQYAEPLRTVIHHFKFKNELYLAPFLVRLMLATLPENYSTDCIIPVPIHLKRLKERGFNQTFLLAKPIATYLKCSLERSLCKKIIHTPAQASLKKQHRAKNLQHAYVVKSNQYQHVTLVDDLITTGNTANEIARALKKTGVKEVHLVCCAKTCLPESRVNFDCNLLSKINRG